MAMDQGISSVRMGPIEGLVGGFLIVALYVLLRPTQAKDNLPLLNGKKLFEFGGARVRKVFAAQIPELLQNGFSKADVFRLLGPNGERLILSPKFADEIKHLPGLSSERAIMENFNAHIPGLEVIIESTRYPYVTDAVKKGVTRNLVKLTKPLSLETEVLLGNLWTDDPSWHEVFPATAAVHMISRISSIVFAGDELGRNSEWLDITVGYNTRLFPAAQALNLWPRALRPLIAHFSPSCRLLRRDIRRARAILLPIIEQRRADQMRGIQAEYNDGIQWLEDAGYGKKDYDPTLGQLALGQASIQTTSDLFTQVLIDLSQRPELVQELREEIVSELGKSGWTNNTLNNLKLMDSVLKESQRMKPPGHVAFPRQTTKAIKLSDGTTIPSGSSLFLANTGMRDPTVYRDPDTYNPHRFVDLRATGNKSAYLVSTSPEHMAFGIGASACPGRFFLANELKIILCHMLLKYDLRLVDDCEATPQTIGLFLLPNPSARILVRRRKEEVDLGLF